MIPFPFNYDDMNFPTLRFVFDRKKIATKTRRGLIQIEVLFKGRRKWIGTGVKVYSDQWDDRKMIINCLESIELNERLSNQRKSIEEWVAELARVNGQFSFDGLERFLNAGQERGEDYISFVERRIEERKDIRESTKKSQRKFPAPLKRSARYGISPTSPFTTSSRSTTGCTERTTRKRPYTPIISSTRYTSTMPYAPGCWTKTLTTA